MEQKRYSPLSIIKNIFLVAVAFWVILGGFPTGWIYDLKAGNGSEQGQKPDASVQALHTQDDVEDFFFKKIPATVSKDDLHQCPLMRLRDIGYAGKHTNARKRTVAFPEYKTMSYPVSFVQKAVNQFAGSALYNSYYLAPLENGSYVCVYFDDYLMLRSGKELPTGYVRYATTEEKKMLHGMAEVFEVDPVYVLDMYRHGKVSWMLDFVIRFVLVLLLGMIYLFAEKEIKKFFKKKREEKESFD